MSHPQPPASASPDGPHSPPALGLGKGLGWLHPSPASQEPQTGPPNHRPPCSPPACTPRVSICSRGGGGVGDVLPAPPLCCSGSCLAPSTSAAPGGGGVAPAPGFPEFVNLYPPAHVDTFVAHLPLGVTKARWARPTSPSLPAPFPRRPCKWPHPGPRSWRLAPCPPSTEVSHSEIPLIRPPPHSYSCPTTPALGSPRPMSPPGTQHRAGAWDPPAPPSPLPPGPRGFSAAYPACRALGPVLIGLHPQGPPPVAPRGALGMPACAPVTARMCRASLRPFWSLAHVLIA